MEDEQSEEINLDMNIADFEKTVEELSKIEGLLPEDAAERSAYMSRFVFKLVQL
jgi:hypothetical protein